METDWTVPMSMAVGGGTVLLSAIIGSRTALRIHRDRRKDDRAEKVRHMADAHKELWHVLQQMKAQAERPGMSRQEPYTMEYYDVQWLRKHFRSNAALLSEELHEEYTAQLKKYIRAVFTDETYGPTDVDFTKMQDIAKSEWDRYERKYRSMGGFDHADRAKPQT